MEQMERTMKKEGAAGEVAASSAEHSDTETDSNFSKPDPGLLQSVKRELSSTNIVLVKEEILEDGSQDDSKPQYVHGALTPAGTGGVNETCSTSLGDLFNVKYESAEMDLGPTVLQPMDIHYTINKHNMSAAMEENTIVDYCNEAMPGSGGRKGSIANKWRDKTSLNCAQTTTEMDYDDAHMKSLMNPNVRLVKEDLQKLLYRFRTTSSNGFKCDRTFHKQHLQSAPDKLRRRNNRRAVTTRGPVAGSSNQSGHIRIKAKQKSCKDQGKTKIISMQRLWRKELKNNLVYYESYTRKTHYTCDEKFAQSGYLTKQATGDKPFQCKTCDAKFARKETLIRHIRVHTGEKAFQCETCDAKFAYKYQLTWHMRVHTGEKAFQCETCDANFSLNSTLTNHMRVHTGVKPFQCETCDARFSQRSSLTNHIRAHTGEKPFQCETCDTKFGYKCELKRHMSVHTGEKPFQCETCDARFSQRTSLTNHIRIHTGEKPFQCVMCDSKFAFNYYLTRHARVVHTGEKPFQCEKCDSKFAQRTNQPHKSLTNHIRVHTGEKPFQCETCDRKFALKRQLTQHMRVHTGEKPFQCERCDAKCSRSGDLITHMRVHTGEKPFQCETCRAKFSRRGSLSSHMRVHGREKPFQCETCDAKYAHKRQLTRHIRVHTAEK